MFAQKACLLLIIALSNVAISSNLLAQSTIEESVQSAQERSHVQRVMVLLEGTEKQPEEQSRMLELQRAHLANIRAMAEAGLLYLAGPLSSSDKANTVRGILVFGAPSTELQRRVESYLESDPMIAAGFLKPRITVLSFERGNSLIRPILPDR